MQYDDYYVSIKKRTTSMDVGERHPIACGDFTEPVCVRVTVAEGIPTEAAYLEIMHSIGYELMKLLKQ